MTKQSPRLSRRAVLPALALVLAVVLTGNAYATGTRDSNGASAASRPGALLSRAAVLSITWGSPIGEADPGP